MIREIAKLFHIQLLRLFSWNEIKYLKDSRKRNRAILMAIAYFIIGINLITYIGSMAYSLSAMGMGEVIPSFVFAITSLMLLLFTIFKTNGILFGGRDYELLMALPISPNSIIITRFLVMYLSNCIFCAIILLPSAFFYVRTIKVSALYYIFLLSSIFLIPLIPMTIAAFIGIIITGIVSHMKHKNLMTIIFSIFATVGIVFLSSTSGRLNESEYANLSILITKQLQKQYPLTILYERAILKNDVVSFLVFAGVSILLFSAFVKITAWKYVAIHSALKAHRVKHHYVVTSESKHSPLHALYKKEGKRYLSSPNYVLNTGIGYLFMIGIGAALFFLGTEKLETMLNMPGLETMFKQASPFMIAAMAVLGSTTVSSISLEGKQWDMLLSLPVEAKVIFDSKILWNLTLSIPSVCITSTLFALKLSITGMNGFWLFIVPVVYSLFSAVVGIFLNLKFPNFSWDNETVVIKQSMPVFISILIGFISVGLPILMIFANKVSDNSVFAGMTICLSLITGFLYVYSSRMDLRKIRES